MPQVIPERVDNGCLILAISVDFPASSMGWLLQNMINSWNVVWKAALEVSSLVSNSAGKATYDPSAAPSTSNGLSTLLRPARGNNQIIHRRVKHSTVFVSRCAYRLSSKINFSLFFALQWWGMTLYMCSKRQKVRTPTFTTLYILTR